MSVLCRVSHFSLVLIGAYLDAEDVDPSVRSTSYLRGKPHRLRLSVKFKCRRPGHFQGSRLPAGYARLRAPPVRTHDLATWQPTCAAGEVEMCPCSCAVTSGHFGQKRFIAFAELLVEDSDVPPLIFFTTESETTVPAFLFFRRAGLRRHPFFLSTCPTLYIVLLC
jgi:hypothetical protein